MQTALQIKQHISLPIIKEIAIFLAIGFGIFFVPSGVPIIPSGIMLLGLGLILMGLFGKFNNFSMADFIIAGAAMIAGYVIAKIAWGLIIFAIIILGALFLLSKVKS